MSRRRKFGKDFAQVAVLDGLARWRESRMAKPSGPTRVAIMGLGAIGRAIAQGVLSNTELSLAGAVDPSPGVAGRPLAEFVPGAPAHLRVERDLPLVLRTVRGGVLLHAARASFEETLPVLEAAARAGVHVVSDCEELAFPWLRHEEEAEALDQLAQRQRVTLLGTGLHPGFVLDRLAATAGAVCGRVRKVRAERVVDLRGCSPELLKRCGVGLAPEVFDQGLEAGFLGTLGLAESAALAALGLGLDWDEFEEEGVAILAEEDIPLPDGSALKKGLVAGISQRARCFIEGREVADLELTLAAGAEDPRDRVVLDAEPNVDLLVKGGYPEEQCAAWAMVNAAPRVAAAEPGILTVLELPAGR